MDYPSNTYPMHTVFAVNAHYALVLFMLGFCELHAQDMQQFADPLSFTFDKHYGQIEVGGRYAGAEFHGSRPLPARVSFFYPVANSIDLSTDYWKRDVSHPMVIGIRRGNAKKEWLGKDEWTYDLSPHRVAFIKKDRRMSYRVSYEFCLNQPAMVQRLIIRNTSRQSTSVEVYTHLKTTLRTCQTYARKDAAWTEYDSTHSAIVTNYDDSDAARATVFVQNAGEQPSNWTSNAVELSVSDSGTSNWIRSSDLKGQILPVEKKGSPVAAFVYRKNILPGDSLVIIQVIGSCDRNETAEKIAYLASHWQAEISDYNRFVRQAAEGDVKFTTEDLWLDRSAVWARGLLASNQHYLDGKVVPMPCPAEYNFFFTHDLLLTNLGAVNFDVQRVKRDLLYVASLAKENIIPHAYYWRDDGYKTEFCTPENWNHLWFIITAARFLRHSGDIATGQKLYPLITKSLSEMLTQLKPDTLMHAFRPDWWDIGHRDGPRSYITILTIRALRDYLYISTVLDRRSEKLLDYERLSDGMQRALGEKLWDDKLQYLINYNDSLKDTHFYMGSLLAPVYNVLEQRKSKELLATASKQLLREPVGVMVVAPPDFHTDSMRTFFKFVGNEAGDPYIYANGGVWPHANAVYALALNATGRTEEALKFVKSMMTLDGIAASPNGLPAMYEYRMSDPTSKDFGKIDKPSFMWAAGFYLNVLYALSGFQDNEWNLSLAGKLPLPLSRVQCSYTFGSMHDVSIEGKASKLKSLQSDGNEIASLVLPNSVMNNHALNIRYGSPTRPYLEQLNAIVDSIWLNRDATRMEIVLSSFRGHQIVMKVVALRNPIRIMADGKQVPLLSKSFEPDGTIRLKFGFPGSDAFQHVIIEF
jgi:glycogen debranching enzyme